jgi:hypothetical protein
MQATIWTLLTAVTLVTSGLPKTSKLFIFKVLGIFSNALFLKGRKCFGTLNFANQNAPCHPSSARAKLRQ